MGYVTHRSDPSVFLGGVKNKPVQLMKEPIIVDPEIVGDRPHEFDGRKIGDPIMDADTGKV